MKIVICGPASLHLIRDLVDETDRAMPGGYQYPLAAYLARILHANGHEVALVTSSASESSSRIWRGEKFRVYHTPRRRFFRFMLDAYAKERRFMLEAINDFKPDVVHAQWTYEFAHVANASGFPALVTARDAPKTIFRHMKTPYRLYRALYANYVIPRIKCMSAISPYVADQIRKEYRYNRSIKVIPNGLSRSLFHGAYVDGEKGNAVTFISVSGWDPRKNVKTLLRAFGKVRKCIPAARLILIGRGLGVREKGANWARSRGLSEGVDFNGPMRHEEIFDVLQKEGDVFVHSTLEESFCMTVLEAMAQGLPTVVLPDSGAVPWLIGNGEAGEIAESQSEDSLSQAMLELAGDGELRVRLGEAGYTRARSMFGLESVAEQYLKVYRDTIRCYAEEA